MDDHRRPAVRRVGHRGGGARSESAGLLFRISIRRALSLAPRREARTERGAMGVPREPRLDAAAPCRAAGRAGAPEASARSGISASSAAPLDVLRADRHGKLMGSDPLLMKLQELAEKLSCRLEGDGSVEIL